MDAVPLPEVGANALTSFERRSAEPVLVHVNGSTVIELTGRNVLDMVDRAYGELEVSTHLGATALVLQTGNTLPFLPWMLAAWRRGLTVIPMSDTYPTSYVADRIRDSVAGPILQLTLTADGDDVVLQLLDDRTPVNDERPGGYVIPTGGSEGRPRMVSVPLSLVDRSVDGLLSIARAAGWKSCQTQLIAGPLDHASSFRFLLAGLRDECLLVIFRFFDPQQFLNLNQCRPIDWYHLTPPQMTELAGLPSFRSDDFRALNGMLHTATRCPRAVKLTWINLLGPDRVFEMYSFTEMIGATLISGREWLTRPTSVGRGFGTQIRILDEARRLLPAGELGKIFLRSPLSKNLRESLVQVGVEITPNGFCSVGDMGWIDDEGYLTVCGVREDIVQEGGRIFYPGLIEDAVRDRPEVDDIVVRSVREGPQQVLAAFVVPACGVTPEDALQAACRHCQAIMPNQFQPEVWHAIDSVHRLPTGKVPRPSLRPQPGMPRIIKQSRSSSSVQRRSAQ